jgi:hypothetical protein
MTNLTSHRSAKSDLAKVAIYTCPASYSDDGSDLNAPALEDRFHSDVSVSLSENSESIERPGIPVVRRAGGIHLPHDQSPKDLKGLGELFEVDVQAFSDTCINNVAGLLSAQRGVFPDSKLPIIPSYISSVSSRSTIHTEKSGEFLKSLALKDRRRSWQSS